MGQTSKVNITKNRTWVNCSKHRKTWVNRGKIGKKSMSKCGIAGENRPTGTKFSMEIIDL